ncbi:hypothetical protein KE273_22365 [Klebsiella sp. MC1F]|uniref:Uncharacterized protein n=1 Tax=Klebsiella quasipneumoniae TaxID=1463165 RepID=A0A2A5MNP2_9ENTR|nr:hypothetical protein AWV58_15720 [Klebsiella quasipneumoniae]AZJ26309.1 hypothetical protein BME36_004740 [Klebsiella quasipneumoniae subsp. similipneumoniae]MBS0841830.1 hypothetical protein [Klebsiella sp. MC1F]OLR84046.1 hypothetical protein BTO25_02625 [Bacillus sp. MB366]OON35470.1 hypothetical protein BU230_34145 [Klebsiella pneumoniae]
MGLFPSYPTFLWITWCKILFIVSDQFWKTCFHGFHLQRNDLKKAYKSWDWYSYSENGKLYPQRAKLALIF